MSNTTPNPAGRFVTKRVTRPAIDVDCSKWVDTTGGGWTFGSFATKNQTRDAVAVECSNWAAEPAMWLEIVASFEDNTSLATESQADMVKGMLDDLAEQIRKVARAAERDGVRFVIRKRDAE